MTLAVITLRSVAVEEAKGRRYKSAFVRKQRINADRAARGLGFGVVGLETSLTKQGGGSWTLASVRACALTFCRCPDIERKFSLQI